MACYGGVRFGMERKGKLGLVAVSLGLVRQKGTVWFGSVVWGAVRSVRVSCGMLGFGKLRQKGSIGCSVLRFVLLWWCQVW
jgi:hypothetical protein